MEVVGGKSVLGVGGWVAYGRVMGVCEMESTEMAAHVWRQMSADYL